MLMAILLGNLMSRLNLVLHLLLSPSTLDNLYIFISQSQIEMVTLWL